MTAEEIEAARPCPGWMTLEQQMAYLALEPKRQHWYAVAVQRKYCSCQMRMNGWYSDELEQGVEIPREELQHLVCLASGEQPKRFVPH